MVSKPSKLQPVLVGGLIIGLGSSIPILESANICCCLWSLIGGAVAALMLVKRSQVMPITSGDGAVTGLLAGLVGSGISLLISVPVRLLLWSTTVENIRSMADRYNDAAARATVLQMARMMEDRPGLFAFLAWLVFSVVGIGFAAVGGIVGVAFFEKRKGQPPEPPQAQLPFDPNPIPPSNPPY